MLFDGTVTLDEDGQSSLELSEPMEPWKGITVSYNGKEYIGVSGEQGGAVGVNAVGDGLRISIYYNGEGFAIVMEDENGDPITGEVTIKVEQGEPELETLYEGTVTLTNQGATVSGQFNVSHLVQDEPLFVYTDGALVAHGYVSSDPITWEDGGAVCGIVTSYDETTWAFMSNNTSLTSVNLKVEAQAT